MNCYLLQSFDMSPHKGYESLVSGNLAKDKLQEITSNLPTELKAEVRMKYVDPLTNTTDSMCTYQRITTGPCHLPWRSKGWSFHCSLCFSCPRPSPSEGSDFDSVIFHSESFSCPRPSCSEGCGMCSVKQLHKFTLNQVPNERSKFFVKFVYDNQLQVCHKC